LFFARLSKNPHSEILPAPHFIALHFFVCKSPDMQLPAGIEFCAAAHGKKSSGF
jgi:hypothetical protein